ncbi:MAG: FecR family protein [Dysgonomonas sp.]|nr:FecR family protein [Dysgonomonas sp.]
MKKDKHNHIKEERELIRLVSSKEVIASTQDKIDSWNEIKNKAEEKLKKGRRKRLLLVSIMSVASLIAFFIISIPYSTETDDLRNKYMEMTESMSPSADEVILYRNLDEEINIPENTTLAYDNEGNITSVSEDIISNTKEAIDKKIQYDKLVVPAGKRMVLILPDSSKIWVNSATKLIYPTQFTEKNREIFVEGEIYLEVKENKEQPFIVKTELFDVRVLGTSFNVSAYRNKKVKSSVALVEGKVDVEHVGGNKKSILSNQLINIEDKSLGMVQEVNARDYITWINDYLLLRSETLENIFGKLSVIYGKDFQLDNNIKSLKISGKLDIRLSYIDVMKTLEEMAPIRIMHSEKQHVQVKYIRK